jgi:hypothetical protein
VVDRHTFHQVVAWVVRHDTLPAITFQGKGIRLVRSAYQSETTMCVEEDRSAIIEVSDGKE